MTTLTPLSILVVSGTYAPDIGGSEASIRTACRELYRRGHRVWVVADDRRPARGEVDGVPVLGVPPDHVGNALVELHGRVRFDVLLTQLIYSREALRWARRAAVPSIYFVRNTEMKLDISRDGPDTPTRLVANSRFIAARTLDRWRREADIIYPLVDYRDFVPEMRGGEAVTCINPIQIKGGDLFRALVRRNPHRQFFCAFGWTGLRRRDGDQGWDPRQWSLMAEAHDDPTVHPPDSPTFEEFPNVTVLPSSPDMRSLYARTRVLLFPSKWEEAFGRSVLEALACGIPVLASDVGGLRETGLRHGGALLDRGADVETWNEALSALDLAERYSEASAAALRDCAWYSLDREVDRLERVCYECADRVN